MESRGDFWDAYGNPVGSSFVRQWTTESISNQRNLADCSGRSTLTVKNSEESTRLRTIKLTDRSRKGQSLQTTNDYYHPGLQMTRCYGYLLATNKAAVDSKI